MKYVDKELLDAASFSTASLQAPTGWVGHIPFAAWAVKKITPRIFVELGTHTGNSYFSICEAIKKSSLETKCYAVDTWIGDDHAGGYQEAVFETVSSFNEKNYPNFSSLLRMTFDEALSNFNDGTIDLLHIDGLHTYEAVRHDFETWLPKLAIGAVVFFHDIGVQEHNFGVWKFWEELKAIYPNNFEFIHSHGLGVLRLSKAEQDQRLPIFDLDLQDQDVIRNYFSTLGHQVLQVFEIQEERLKSIKLACSLREIEDRARESEDRARELNISVEYYGNLIHALLSSNSWRVTKPLRWLGSWLARIRRVLRTVWSSVKNPRIWSKRSKQIYRAWKSGGWSNVRRSIAKMQEQKDSFQKHWEKYVIEVREKVLPRLEENKQLIETGPLISVLIPTYNTNPEYLLETIKSVKEQIYLNWELCIVDDCSTMLHVEQILKDAAKKDPRIKIKFLASNKGVAAATNAAINIASGEFIVFLDHDDVLERQALMRVAESIEKDSPDFLYTDEVVVSEDLSEVEQMVCRPSFSPELLRGHPYIVHLIGFKATLLRKIGGLNEQLKISQDYDLILRATEAANVIVHIPEVLYRWRTHKSSAGHKLQHLVTDASTKILQGHFQRLNLDAESKSGQGFNWYSVEYDLNKPVKVAIIIPTKDGVDLLRACIESIQNTTNEEIYDLFVINHESVEEKSLQYFSEISKKCNVMDYSGEFNFSKINNWAVNKLEGEYTHILFCNNDIEALENGWLEGMLAIAQQSNVGIVGPMLMYGDSETIQHAGVCLGIEGRAEHFGKFHKLSVSHLDSGYLGSYILNHEVSAVTAACLLIKKEIFKEVGGFDEEIKVGFGDVDLCLKVFALGFSVLISPNIKLIHHESKTRGISYFDTHPEDTKYFLEKWSEMIVSGDFFYNPGLSLSSTTWEYKTPIPILDNPIRRVSKRVGISTKFSYHYSI